MLNGIIDFSLRNRALVIALTLAAAAVGAVSIQYLNIDAFPDTSPVMLQVNTAAPGLTPEEVELQITYPIEQAIGGLPGLQTIRSTSKFGLSQVVIKAKDGVPVTIADIGEVVIGYEIRRGVATADGQGEVVLGLGFMLMGENPHEVTRKLKEKLAEIEPTLPPGVKVTVLYDRTELVDFVIDTARKNLFEGGLLVIAILFALLGNLRGALIVAVAIPLSMLFAFSGMLQFGIAASLLSLGAIDFGMVVDSSVVMVENCVRRLAHNNDTQHKREIIREAALEVRRPTLFGELIIMVVYLPILTLEGIEGKMFRPMALTVIFALAGSMVLSLTLMPVLASLILPRKLREHEPLLMRIARWIYTPMLDFTMRFRLFVIAITLAIAVVAFGMIAPNLGAEFVPKLSEGAIAMNVVRLAGTDLDESVRYNSQMEKVILAKFPDEVNHVWARIGAAEVATDPMGLELTDMYVSLTPRSQWTKATTQAELTILMEEALRDLPGQEVLYTQPIDLERSERRSTKPFGTTRRATRIYSLKFRSIVSASRKKSPTWSSFSFPMSAHTSRGKQSSSMVA